MNIASLLPLLYPVISFIGTEVSKYLWEKWFTKWPKVVSLSVAAGLGAGLSTAVQSGDSHITPVVGGILGLAANLIHDFLTPPSTVPTGK
jgi:hypothetical protein